MSGCSPIKYQERVMSFVSDKQPSCKKYIIIPDMKFIQLNDTEFVEYKNHVINFLNDQGYENSKSPSDICVLVLLSYNAGEIKFIPHDDIYPITGVTGGGTSTVQMSTITGKTYYGTITTPTTYGTTGYIRDSWSEPIATNYMQIMAIDIDAFEKYKNIVQFWKIDISQTGEPTSLRESIPKMLGAATGSIGVKISRTVDVHKNGTMKVIKEIMN